MGTQGYCIKHFLSWAIAKPFLLHHIFHGFLALRGTVICAINFLVFFFTCVMYVYLRLWAFYPPPSSLMKDFEVNTFNHLSVYVVGAVGWLFDLWCNDQWSREVICCKMSANQLLLLFFITKFVIVTVKLWFYKIFMSLWFCETHTCCLLTDHF